MGFGARKPLAASGAECGVVAPGLVRGCAPAPGRGRTDDTACGIRRGRCPSGPTGSPLLRPARGSRPGRRTQKRPPRGGGERPTAITALTSVVAGGFASRSPQGRPVRRPPRTRRMAGHHRVGPPRGRGRAGGLFAAPRHFGLRRAERTGPGRGPIGGVQHLALSVDAPQFGAARQALDEAGVEYVGPDHGVDDSLYFHDPNGVPLELYRERLGVFNGERILPGAGGRALRRAAVARRVAASTAGRRGSDGGRRGSRATRSSVHCVSYPRPRPPSRGS
ncbi:VOC family protein [Streptomyces sp. NPDC048389]|uniref:VOC family protein n=1 Tax=Streptomyces sp. NPDC048389 TaxID=3154622 RepID=UPI003456DBA2